uniref:Uncharacterized protein LOC102805312 n=1 Tax=Saccoglossus kowalevskii TaxID=10224 RepID=A0ABM0MC88_SACKO
VFIERPTNVSTAVGSYFSLRCSGSNSARISWMKDNKSYKQSKSYADGRWFQSRKKHILVVNAEFEDSGMYTCRLLHKRTKIGEVNAWVDVREKPRLTEENHAREVALKESVITQLNHTLTVKQDELLQKENIMEINKENHAREAALKEFVIKNLNYTLFTIQEETAQQIHE